MGALVVDGSKSNANLVAGTQNVATFAEGSLLVVNADGVDEDTAMLSNTGGVLTMDAGAKLYIDGGKNGQELTVVAGFTGAGGSLAADAWSGDNAMPSSVSYEVTVERLKDFF